MCIQERLFQTHEAIMDLQPMLQAATVLAMLHTVCRLVFKHSQYCSVRVDKCFSESGRSIVRMPGGNVSPHEFVFRLPIFTFITTLTVRTVSYA
jgi:hypothetical protein